ncbi:Damage-control phosphatase [Podosphaera aphanis]|nr:Damage-control phosphatase [Podosphaera aphanis]
MEYDTKTPPYSTADQTSFAYKSARDRWPVILTGAIDDLHKAVSETKDEAKLKEGKKIVADLAKLKHELQHDRPLSPLIDDGEPDIPGYNKEIETLKSASWFNCPWLFVECYLYRRIATCFSISHHWKSYDVFAHKKWSTFRSSRPATIQLASRYQELLQNMREKNSRTQDELDVTEKALFMEMCEICLWGNATDLSLLTSVTYEDIQKLQDMQERKALETKVIVNDLEAVYDSLKNLKNLGKEERKVDIILDNAGYELYVDLVLAGFLLSAGLATNIILHPKSIPWFVSDVLPSDFLTLLNILASPQEFYSAPSDDDIFTGKTPEPLSQNEIDALSFLFRNLGDFHGQGKILLRPNIFWTEGGSYWRLPAKNPSLFKDLKESELVIFKGDLNYRKLTGDAMWNPTTPFTEAIGPLGPGSGLNILALRTCKSDVVVGLNMGEDEKLRAVGGSATAREWAWSGKWAVMSYSRGK